MKTMLIVDDSDYMRTLIKSHVTKHDINVIGEAEDGATGVEEYKKLKPDIVTMDLAMHDGDGLEAVKKIIEFDLDAKIMIVSSIAGQDIVVSRALEAGAKTVIDKNALGKDLIEGIFKMLMD